MEPPSCSGLRNLGNTCYMNSILQCLFHTDKLNSLFEEKDVRVRKDIQSIITIEYNELRKLANKKSSIIQPTRFWKRMQQIAQKTGYEQFVGQEQNDSNEFLNFILDCFHESLKHKVSINIQGRETNRIDRVVNEFYKQFKQQYENEYSKIIEIFFNLQVTIITDINSSPKILSIKADPTMMLYLPIPDQKFIYKNHLLHNIEDNDITIYDCIDLYTYPEKLQGENQWFNEELGEKQDAMKKTLFYKFPDILIINLKRFNYTQMKQTSLVKYPIENLDLTNYIIPYRDRPKYIYDLYAVCNHIGRSPDSGHYTSYIKNGDKWINFNDDRLSIIKDKEKLVTENAYCLFYKRREL